MNTAWALFLDCCRSAECPRFIDACSLCRGYGKTWDMHALKSRSSTSGSIHQGVADSTTLILSASGACGARVIWVTKHHSECLRSRVSRFYLFF